MGLPRIIGLSGKIGTGKTTLANLLLKNFPEYERIAFGDILKQESSEMHGYPLEWAYSEEGKSNIVNPSTEKEHQSFWRSIGELFNPPIPDYGDLPRYDMTVREVLQWHGTEFRRNQDPNYWVRVMNDHIKDNPWVVIDDVRFVNEAKLVQSLGGMLIRVNPHNMWEAGEFANHASEIDLDDYSKFDLKVDQKWNFPKVSVDIITNFINNLN